MPTNINIDPEGLIHLLDAIGIGPNAHKQKQAEGLFAQLFQNPQNQGPPSLQTISNPTPFGVNAMQSQMVPPTQPTEQEREDRLGRILGQLLPIAPNLAEPALKYIQSRGYQLSPEQKIAQQNADTRKAQVQEAIRKNKDTQVYRNNVLDIQKRATDSLIALRNRLADPKRPLTEVQRQNALAQFRDDFNAHNRNAITNNNSENLNMVSDGQGGLTFAPAPKLPVYGSIEEFAKAIGQEDVLAKLQSATPNPPPPDVKLKPLTPAQIDHIKKSGGKKYLEVKRQTIISQGRDPDTYKE